MSNIAEKAANADLAVALTGVRLSRAGSRILDLDEWSLPAGRHGLLHGPSGGGKTTLLHLIAGLELPDAGTIRVLDETVTRLGSRERDHFRARRIGLVFQDFHLLGGLSVEDNLRLPQWLARRPQAPSAARELLRRMDIGHLAGHYPHQLSQGEKQRVAIARAVINGPRLILADEPTSALDDENAQRVLDLLLAEAERHGASLLVASHDARITGVFDATLRLEPPR